MSLFPAILGRHRVKEQGSSQDLATYQMLTLHIPKPPLKV